MAMNMDALLRIRAAVTGADQVAALGSKFNQVQGAAARLTSGVGPLGSALGALAPVATVGGLGALVMKTIEAGDAMNDLSQRTGVSVESLARFKKAAATSGTDIDSVAKALGKLSKGMYEAATTGKGATAEALKALGISAKDAAGNLKTADQVTLEIADRFKTMPDGVQKTALAMQLFGKAGAEMIPMLNEGGKAIESLSVKMTTAFAQKADEYKDKLIRLSGKVGGLAAGLTVALLPALDAVATGLTFVVDAFTKLPGPIQAIIGTLSLLAIAITALIPLFAGLSLAIAPLAGTGLKAAILASFSGVLSWMGTVFVPTMLAFFSGPAGWITLAVIAVGAMVIAFREPIGKFLAWVGEGIAKVAKTIGDGITGAIGSAWQWLTKAVGNVAQALAKPFEVAVGGIKAAVRGVLQYVANSVNIVTGLVNSLIRGFNRLPGPDLPEIPFVTVPSFAGGGYTGSGPRTGGIDGRGGFMAMLHPQETVIDHTRGAAAALGSAATAAASAPSITIQTGPILQQPDGSQWVSVGDLQAAMQATAAAVMGTLRTPGARVALRGA